MSKIVVVYKSKYGSTKKYAEWIAKAVNADLFPCSKITAQELLRYDIVIYGGGLYMLGISGFSLIKDNFDMLKYKKLIVFSVGLSPARPSAIEDVITKNFSDEMRESICYFHLRGGLDYNKMNALDKLLMLLLKKRIESIKPEERDSDSKSILATYGKVTDFSNRKYIQPIVDCINSMQ